MRPPVPLHFRGRSSTCPSQTLHPPFRSSHTTDPSAYFLCRVPPPPESIKFTTASQLLPSVTVLIEGGSSPPFQTNSTQPSCFFYLTHTYTCLIRTRFPVVSLSDPRPRVPSSLLSEFRRTFFCLLLHRYLRRSTLHFKHFTLISVQSLTRTSTSPLRPRLDSPFTHVPTGSTPYLA